MSGRRNEAGREEAVPRAAGLSCLRASSRRGIALLMVLWVLVMLSIVALSFLKSSRWNSASTRNLKDETLSYYLALSGYEEAVNYLVSDKAPEYDFIDGEGNFWIDSETQPVTGRRSTGDGDVEILINDENARININFANRERLTQLFAYCGVKQDELNGIIDSVLDWKDADSDHRLSGAEDEYYGSLQEPYKAKNALFDVPEELAMVKGMKPEYLHGGEGAARPLLPLITTFGRSGLNINTVSKEVMELLGLNEVEIETILKQRNKDYGGFRFAPQQFSARGLNAVAAQNFRIEVTAKTPNSPIASKVIGVVNRQPSPDGVKFKTIYWSERAETVRT